MSRGINIGHCQECGARFVCGDCICPRCPKCEEVHRRGNKVCGYCQKEKPLAEFPDSGSMCHDCAWDMNRRLIDSQHKIISELVALLRDTRSYSIGNGVPLEWFIKRATILKRLEYVK